MRPRLTSPVEAITHSLRALVVAERPHMRKLVRGLLVNSGIKHIDEASDGISGIEQVKAFDPDVVILDWDLPLLSGPEVVRIVRTPGMSARPGVPIIVFSASASRRRIAEAKQIGVDSFVVLPMSAKTLLDRILSAVANAHRVREGHAAPQYTGTAPASVFMV
jgi:two-component system chemotaxis response regulator CheY